MFADRYVEKNIVYPEFIDAAVSPLVSMIVMIPCLNEPEIYRTLESLWSCDLIKAHCEVIVVVNEPETGSQEIKRFNQETYVKLFDWKRENDREDLICIQFMHGR